jgi:tetratricopeptide (TPR) repeat protein
LVGAAIFNFWDGNRRIEASRVLAHIQKIANAELLSSGSEAKDSDSKQEGKQGKTGDKTDSPDAAKDGVPRFKTAPERQAAVVKELDLFLAGHAAWGLKAEALVMKGSALLGLGRHDDAIAAYQAALDGHLDVRLRFLAHEGQGYAYEGKRELDKALAAFGKIAGDAAAFGGFYSDRALYHKARLTEVKGDKAGAVAIYHQILDKIPGTTMKDEISDRLAVLEGK